MPNARPPDRGLNITAMPGGGIIEIVKPYIS
jgi:hypothetical protein